MSANEAGGAPPPLGARESSQPASRRFRQTARQFLPGVEGRCLYPRSAGTAAHVGCPLLCVAWMGRKSPAKGPFSAV